MNYKDTLNLPQTDFPMKANLSQKETVIMRFWEENKIYEKIQEKNRKNKNYILHDGPPYANGRIHIGHALNKILKDIIIKYKSMKGFYSPYVPGWDCHGLPIEHQVDKNLGERKEEIDILEKRSLCREYAETFVDIQRYEFRRLGVFGDWQSPYLTMSFSYEATIVREFFKFVEAGCVYKGKKPVHWCPSCVTALAEAEVEYGDKESSSIYVKFKVQDSVVQDRLPNLTGKKVFIVIWTTTPWTLPANLALAVHPDFEYVAVEREGEVYIIAEKLLDSLREKLLPEGDALLKIQGRKLEGMIAEHPFIDRKSKVILGDFVSADEGTGIVHIAPGHGEDDYEIGLKYGLDIYAPVDDRGHFKFTGAEQVLPIQGKFVFKANAEIIDILKNKNVLLKEEKMIHSYPHCWRCKKPVIFRATEQWFISMEKNKLREKSLSEIDSVTWIPGWGKDRIRGMVVNRPDWCISRQRAWGVPITLIRCDGCGEFIKEDEVFESIIKSFEENGADVWFMKKTEEFLPPAYRCKNCGGNSFSKETDILDVWFDSGVSHAAVIEADDRLSWPAYMYLEGSDQHRGWFQSSLLASVGTRGKAPYRTVLTHGFVVDGQGKKMSKSLGNVVAPQEVIKTNGAEILRLWVSAEDYRDDIRISKEILDRLTEAYRKIRNTCRFLLGNIYDFDGRDYSKDLLEIDRWAMSRLQTLINKVVPAYEGFDFHEVFHCIHNFCVVDMSSFYLDVLKDRLYTFKSDSAERRAAQWVLYRILSVMTRLMAPILSFTAEEVWQSLSSRESGVRSQELPPLNLPLDKGGIEGGEESVFLTAFPEVDENYYNQELEEKWDDLFVLRNEVNKALEMKRAERFIGNSLEAKTILYIPGQYKPLLTQYMDFLPVFFIVSAVEITDKRYEDSYKSIEVEGLEIKVVMAPGAKCQRCWNWSEKVGKFEEAPDICERCYKVIFEPNK
ncbi:MAG: isoleucine--tRNA ligase [Thermodesulfovibrio sp. RBG_19FT_COMBO_42_12]|nr:MAG: isoleucine--tRNA ligase [Thermodesulfovibrio sp. RBG_19FT_COMBO_42_12]